MMNRKQTLATSVIAALVAGCGTISAETPRMASGNGRELWLAGDFDGNGRPDAAVIDRESGLMRVGYGQAGGGISFPNPVSCGGAGVTWALAAPLTVQTRDQMVVFAPESNRLHLLGLSNPGWVSNTPVYAAGAGPRTGAALDLAGASNTTSLDLLVHDQYTSVPTMAGSLCGVRNSGGTFSQLGELQVPYRFDQAAALVPASGQAAHAGWMRRQSGSSAFEFRAVTISSFTLLDEVAGLPENARYACGTFDTDRLDLFFYTPGAASGSTCRLDDQAVPGEWRFENSLALDFGAAVDTITVLSDADGTSDLLLIYQDGSAATASYAGSAGLGAFQAVATGAAKFAAGGVALASGEFLLFTSSQRGGGSDGWSHYALNGGTATLLDEGALPPLGTTPAGANVLLFESHPFRTANARLLGSYHVFDWTTAVDLDSSPGKVFASGLSLVDPVTGLATPQITSLTVSPAGATMGLVNQYHPQISIIRTDSPNGELPVDVEASPPAGHYSEAVEVVLAAMPASAGVFYRTGDGPFTAYATTLQITRDTTLEYYATDSGVSSPLRTARFTFAAAPENLDADGDGVPDFVESALGLDPAGGIDHDGDGFSDLEELLSSTDPADPADAPASHANLGDILTLMVTPRPYDFILGSGSTAGIGTEIRARTSDGQLLGMQSTGHVITYPFRADVACRPIASGMRWMTLATPFHYGMTTAAADKLRGREIAALLAVPEPEPVAIDITYNPASEATQPAAWISAAQAAYASAARPAIVLDLDIFHSLQLVLAERSLASVLSMRGDIAPGTKVCVTPFRQPDALLGGFVPDEDSLAALERPSPTVPTAPALLPRDLLASLDSLVRAPAPDAGMLALQNLTTEIYRISAQYHNSAPGELPLPLDALRHTLDLHALPEYYATRSSWTSAQILAACAAADAVTANPPGIRTKLTLTLLLGASGGECTPATDTASGITYALLAADGARFELPESWALDAGTRITVVAYPGAADVCGYPSLWVLQSAFDTVVLPGRNDIDGDLLDDAWEMFHFGHYDYGFRDDPSHTGYSLGEEFFSQTDPNNPANLPAGAPVLLAFSPVRVEWPDGLTLRLTTRWPADYADQIEVAVFSSSDLNGFADTGIVATHLGGGLFVAEFSRPSDPQSFFQLRARLK